MFKSFAQEKPADGQKIIAAWITEACERLAEFKVEYFESRGHWCLIDDDGNPVNITEQELPTHWAPWPEFNS